MLLSVCFSLPLVLIFGGGVLFVWFLPLPPVCFVPCMFVCGVYVVASFFLLAVILCIFVLAIVFVMSFLPSGLPCVVVLCYFSWLRFCLRLFGLCSN